MEFNNQKLSSTGYISSKGLISYSECYVQSVTLTLNFISTACQKQYHGSGRKFNSVATDQALEQTINKEGNSQGGIVGFTHRKGAGARWLITRHVTIEYAEAMNGCCDGVAHAQKSHKEHGAARMDRDEREILQIMEYVQDRQNPFD